MISNTSASITGMSNGHTFYYYTVCSCKKTTANKAETKEHQASSHQAGMDGRPLVYFSWAKKYQRWGGCSSFHTHCPSASGSLIYASSNLTWVQFQPNTCSLFFCKKITSMVFTVYTSFSENILYSKEQGPFQKLVGFC
jgi:hypothetical protein